jgi:hypothetical protein
VKGLATALCLIGGLTVAGTARAEDPAGRGGPVRAEEPARRAAPVRVTMPGAVLRATARRPRVVIEITRAPVAHPLSAGTLGPPLPSGERVGVRGGTFVDRITRSVSGERF